MRTSRRSRRIRNLRKPGRFTPIAWISFLAIYLGLGYVIYQRYGGDDPEEAARSGGLKQRNELNSVDHMAAKYNNLLHEITRYDAHSSGARAQLRNLQNEMSRSNRWAAGAANRKYYATVQYLIGQKDRKEQAQSQALFLFQQLVKHDAFRSYWHDKPKDGLTFLYRFKKSPSVNSIAAETPSKLPKYVSRVK